MHRQVRQVLEALPTDPAGVRPLLGVAALVHGEVGLLAEALPARGAGVGPLSRVRPLVLVEVRWVGEGLPARPAGVGPLAGVQPLVGGESGEVAEAFAARAAGVGLHPGVGPLVGLQVGQAAEGLPAFPTWVGTLLAVFWWFRPWFLSVPGVLRWSGWCLGRWEGGGILWDRSGAAVGLGLRGSPGGGASLGDAGGMRGVLGCQNGVLWLCAGCGGTCCFLQTSLFLLFLLLLLRVRPAIALPPLITGGLWWGAGGDPPGIVAGVASIARGEDELMVEAPRMVGDLQGSPGGPEAAQY